ncbi:MAG: polysaccharide deacetylase family protein [Cyanobacteria bacterium P01_H01_bin.121]
MLNSLLLLALLNSGEPTPSTTVGPAIARLATQTTTTILPGMLASQAISQHPQAAQRAYTKAPADLASGSPAQSATVQEIFEGQAAFAATTSDWPATEPSFSTDAAANAARVDRPFDAAGNPIGAESGVNPLACPVPGVHAANPMPEIWQRSFAWVDPVQAGVIEALATYPNQAIAYANASDWPDIHFRARQANVPVMMYHDILPEKEVFFDVTIDELREHFEAIQAAGVTPVSLDDLVLHLRTGVPLPAKPMLLTFDDGYEGHYTHVLPLLREFNFPATFSIFTAKVDGDIVGRSTVTWEQVREMAADPLVTIAAHSVTHPRDLTLLEDAELYTEIVQSKARLEAQLGLPIRHFTYPEGNYDERVAELVAAAGFESALTMDDWNEGYAGDSESLLAIDRFGQSRLFELLDFDEMWGGPPAPTWTASFTRFNFETPIQHVDIIFDDIPIRLVSGGKPVTIHADSRYQVKEIIESVPVEGKFPVAGVDGAFFSLEFLDSNTLIGPVFSRTTGQFVPGNPGENPLLNNRPLVLIGDQEVKFVPFQADRHNTLAGVQAEMPAVKDAFVGAAWLVRDGAPQPAENFGNLFDFDAARDRAFWGINQRGQPVVGVSREMVDSISLGEMLAQAGLRDAVMLDSGASTSLVYRGQSMIDYEARPVPHVVALIPTVADAVAASEHCVAAAP